MAEQTGVMDYLAWRGDLTFERDPWNAVDGVLLSILAYEDLGDAAASEEGIRLHLIQPDTLPPASHERRREMLLAMAQTERFRNMLVYRQVNDVDPERDIQFSAVTCEIPGLGTIIAYRGTDKSVVGWKEDFMMSYESPVPAQSAALEYLNLTASRTRGPVYLVGHSKGGNLALYAASHAQADIRQRIVSIGSYDGPGLDDETIASEGYLDIQPRIQSMIPQGSIVGQLMNYTPNYTIVHSSSLGWISQHDLFSWAVLGNHLVQENETTKTSQIMDQTVHEWLKSCSAEDRRTFIEVAFSMLEDKETEEKDMNSRLQGALASLKSIDAETRKTMSQLFKKLLSIGASRYVETMFQKPLSQVAGDLLSRLYNNKEESTHES